MSSHPNLRKPLWKREEDAREAIEWSLRQADIIKISDEEIDWLWGISPEEGAEKLLREYRASRGLNNHSNSMVAACFLEKGKRPE